jgi:hypothetical protein
VAPRHSTRRDSRTGFSKKPRRRSRTAWAPGELTSKGTSATNSPDNEALCCDGAVWPVTVRSSREIRSEQRVSGGATGMGQAERAGRTCHPDRHRAQHADIPRAGSSALCPVRAKVSFH